MSDKANVNASAQRRTRNEQLFAQENQRVKEMAEGVLDTESEHFLPLAFTCECSDSECTQKIEMPMEDYKVAHQYEDRFVIVPGHEQTDIERVVDRSTNIVIVEKLQ